VSGPSPSTLGPAQKAALVERYLQRMRSCVPWSPAVKWEPELNFLGHTYRVLELFPGIEPSDGDVETLGPGQHVDSPGGSFRYCVRLHRAGRPIQTWWESRVGTALFDQDIVIPALFEARAPEPSGRRFEDHPWMSLTPGEILTLRPGTRCARGHVVIAGLGLGHQLIECSKRLQVRRITLVERSAELVDFLLPRIRPLVKKPLQVVIGDAYEVVPTLSADVALVDIFPAYGNNQPGVDAMARRSSKIGKFWGWGAAPVSGAGLPEG
jgi:hypothetical protein